MAAKFVAEEGTLKGLVLSLEDGDHWVIGRDPDACQLLVEDSSASRKHLICRTTKDGILVENLSKTNPVQVNNEEITEPRLLQNGDAVKIGSGTFRFYDENGSKDANPYAINGNESKTDGKVKQPGSEDHKDAPKNAIPDDSNEDRPIEDIPGDPSNNQASSNDTQDTNSNEQPKELKSEEGFNEVNRDQSEAEKLKTDASVQKDLSNQGPGLDSQALMPDVNINIKEEETIKAPIMETKAQDNTLSQNISAPNNAASPLTPQPNNEPPSDEEPEQSSLYQDDDTEKSHLAEIDFGLLDTGRWLLKVISGPNNGAEFSMQTGDTYVIGTDPNTCDVVFHDTSVSRQHARITISQDDVLTIEDLKSRNGTMLDGLPLKGKQNLTPNLIVALGTTSFIVFDREGEMQTIISPLMPSIVKVLQTAEAEKVEAKEPSFNSDIASLEETVPEPAPHPTLTAGTLILIAILTGLFVIVGIGTSTLFRSEPVALKESVDPLKSLESGLAPFPSVKFTFNQSTGQLLLVGHVLSTTDKAQLMYALQGLPFIKSLDDSSVVIDEYVWREINQILDKNPDWKGINVMSTTPGHFVVSGYLKTRNQADRLNEYLSSNFPYPELLEKKIIVDQEILDSVNSILQTKGLNNLTTKLDNGEITITGGIPTGKNEETSAAMAAIKEVRGIRSVRNLTSGIAPEQSIINISDKYEITGISNLKGKLSVVINGRILMKGDSLDEMTISSIQPNIIYLERDGVKYKIEFKR